MNVLGMSKMDYICHDYKMYLACLLYCCQSFYGQTYVLSYMHYLFLCNAVICVVVTQQSDFLFIDLFFLKYTNALYASL